MFTVSVQNRFWASHQLTLADGSTESLHSHNWLVEAEVGAERLNDMGLVMDFNRLKNAVEKITAQFGTGPLEKIDYFRRNNSSAEMVAKYVYGKLEAELPEGVMLNCVKITEEAGCIAEFRP